MPRNGEPLLAPGRINVGYLDKQVNQNTRRVADSWWRDLINRYGVNIKYYPIEINTEGRHRLYEEVFEFQPPKNIRMFPELSGEAYLFAKFGLHTDSDLTAVVHIGTWVNIFGPEIENEPKVGDILRIDNTGWLEEDMDIHTNTGYASGDSVCSILNRNIDTTCQLALEANKFALANSLSGSLSGNTHIDNMTLYLSLSDGDWRRWPRLYQITERRYLDPELNTNFLGGQYVWVLRAKRFEYSYEPGAPQENPIAPDNTPGGIVNDNDTIEEISEEIFDYDEFPFSNDSVYGGF